MDSIWLKNKKTGRILACDICLSNYPQFIELTIENGEGHNYATLQDLADAWEIATNEELEQKYIKEKASEEK